MGKAFGLQPRIMQLVCVAKMCQRRLLVIAAMMGIFQKNLNEILYFKFYLMKVIEWRMHGYIRGNRKRCS